MKEPRKAGQAAFGGWSFASSSVAKALAEAHWRRQ